LCLQSRSRSHPTALFSNYTAARKRQRKINSPRI
jgi:hypothetical protein